MSKKFLSILVLWFYACGSAGAQDNALHTQGVGGDSRDAASWQETFLQNVRESQRQQELQLLEDSNEQARVGTTQEAPLAAESLSAQDASPIYGWFSDNQKASPLGLVTSYPQDASLVNQAFTYDQALSGILMLQQGDTAGAKKIFDFYNSQWDGQGYWTVYNTQSVGGAKVEYDRVMGPNAWIGLFALHYQKKTGNAKALDLATKIANWIRTLPHKDGGVAMGAAGSFWGDIYSVENNLDYYALARALSTRAKSKRDRQLFTNEVNGLKSWFKNQAYDASTGLFKRSPSDTTPTAALDSNSWAVLAFGADSLRNDFGIDPDALVARTEQRFSVQDDGSFGGSVLEAKGFDFSDSANASRIGRSGMKWIEGTGQMISVYRLMASANPSQAAYYENRAGYFEQRNAENAVAQGSTVSYLYTDAPGRQIWWDNPYWNASAGPAVGSSAWVYYSTLGFNPFDI